jgi:hypothetical protein
MLGLDERSREAPALDAAGRLATPLAPGPQSHGNLIGIPGGRVKPLTRTYGSPDARDDLGL